MELLLILSALLSALTGATGTRAPGVRLHQATAVAQAAARAVAAPVTVMRPIAALPMLVALAVAPRTAALALMPVSPLYTGRRRE